MSLDTGAHYSRECRDKFSRGPWGRKRELVGHIQRSRVVYHLYLEPTSHWEPSEVFLQGHDDRIYVLATILPSGLTKY